MTAGKRSAVEWGAAALKAVLPIVAIGWYANQAITRIEEKASSAVAQVAAAVQDVRLAQTVHEKTDDQRQVFTDQRLDRVERRQDSLETTLSGMGIQAGLPPERRRRADAAP